MQLNDGGTRVLAGDQVFLNLGTHAAIPDIPGLEAARPLTHIEALELDYLPSHLIVLGGGYVGLELAQAYRRFGSRVTVIEPGPQLMGREDPDVSAEMLRILGDEGMGCLTAAEPLDVRGRSGEEVSVTVRTTAGAQRIEGSDILVAAGRVPNTVGIGLEEAGVELEARGYIRVNERLETSAADVWAIGECAGSPQFTHVSIDDFRIIKDNLAGGKESTRDRLVPYCMFTEPPLAHVGLSERDAQRQGVAARVARLPMSWVRRTATTDETQGFMKVLVGASDDRILGFTMIGAEACEKAGIDPYVPRPQRGPSVRAGLFRKDEFSYDPARESFLCPAGQQLHPYSSSLIRGLKKINYRNSQACRDCPIRSQCTGNQFRSVSRFENEAVLDRMQARIAQRPDILDRRRETVEHPFGTIKQWMNQGAFLMRGLEKVRAEFSLTALAYNLRRVLNIVAFPDLIAALQA